MKKLDIENRRALLEVLRFVRNRADIMVYDLEFDKDRQQERKDNMLLRAQFDGFLDVVRDNDEESLVGWDMAVIRDAVDARVKFFWSKMKDPNRYEGLEKFWLESWRSAERLQRFLETNIELKEEDLLPVDVEINPEAIELLASHVAQIMEDADWTEDDFSSGIVRLMREIREMYQLDSSVVEDLLSVLAREIVRQFSNQDMVALWSEHPDRTVAERVALLKRVTVEDLLWKVSP